MNITRAEETALKRLASLRDEYGVRFWKTSFVGTHSAGICRRSLEKKGLVEIRKQNDGYRYAITLLGRSIISGAGE